MGDAPLDLSTFRAGASIGVLAVLLAWESASPFLDFFRGKTWERARHGARNLFLGLVNVLMASAGFAVAWGAAARWAERNHFGLLHWSNLSLWPHAMLAVLLLDFWTYWWHWMNHRIPFLWRFHRTHHSDPGMDVTTANRFHLGEIFMSSVLRIVLIALIGIRLWELVLYEIFLFAVVQFHHANIGLPEWLDRGLRCLIPTPAMHKVHHSRSAPETDSNYSSLLSVWDRIFGSFRLRENPHEIRFGLDDWDAPEHQKISGLLKTPLANPRK